MNNSMPTWKNAASFLACALPIGRFPDRSSETLLFVPSTGYKALGFNPRCSKIVRQVYQQLQQSVFFRRQVPLARRHQAFHDR